MNRVMLGLVCGLLLTACSPEVGSQAWCEQMKAKPKGDWTANEAGDYARHCIFSGTETDADSANQDKAG